MTLSFPEFTTTESRGAVYTEIPLMKGSELNEEMQLLMKHPDGATDGVTDRVSVVSYLSSITVITLAGSFIDPIELSARALVLP